MKKTKIILSLIFCALMSLEARAQQDFTAEQAANQEIYVQFDKPFYLSGETLWFSIFNSTADAHRLIFGRRFMELALVDRNKQIVVKERIKVEDGRSAGQIQLPSYLTTGHYMMVISYPFEELSNFLYRKVIPIYNPEDVINKNPAANRQIAAQAPTVDKTDSDYVTMVANKRNYGPRERVSVTVNLKGFDQAELSVVVREKGMALEKQRDIRSMILDPGNPEVAATLTASELTNYREQKPLYWNLLSSHGLLLYELPQKDSLTENSIPYAYVPEKQVALSIFEVRPGQFVLDGTLLPGGETSFFFNNFTFNKRLINNMTHWTERDMADNMGTMRFDWIVRPRDYGQVLTDELTKAPTVSSYVVDYVHRHRLRQDIYGNNAYIPVPEAGLEEESNRMMYEPIDFKPLSDYSEMVDVPEFLKEVSGGMRVWNTDRRKDLRLAYSGGRYNSPPLFLINGIPTNDIERAFQIPMEDIHGIGVIKDPQNQTQRDQVKEVAQYGYFGSNGIIVIHLKEGADNPFQKDFNELLSTRLYIESERYPIPDYNRNTLKSPSPDFRPVLFWDPAVKARRGRASFDFFTSDDVGIYEIVVEGIGQNGEVIHATQSIVLGNPKLFEQE